MSEESWESGSRNPFLLIEVVGDWAGDHVADLVGGGELGEFVGTFIAYLLGVTILFLGAMFVLSFLRFKLGTRWLRRSLGRNDTLGLAYGTGLGVLTPVCSCFVASVYATLLRNGASERAAAAYLFAAPAVNEVAIALMFAATGLRGAALYLGLGILAAMITGRFSRLLGLIPHRLTLPGDGEELSIEAMFQKLGWRQAVSMARCETQVMVKRLALPLIVGCALAAWFEGFLEAPVEILRQLGSHPFAPAVAAAVGLPLDVYAPAAAPVILSLAAIGIPLGTITSLMMAMTLASFPEGAVLYKIIGWRGVAKVGAWFLVYTATIGMLINLLLVPAIAN